MLLERSLIKNVQARFTKNDLNFLKLETSWTWKDLLDISQWDEVQCLFNMLHLGNLSSCVFSTRKLFVLKNNTSQESDSIKFLCWSSTPSEWALQEKGRVVRTWALQTCWGCYFPQDPLLCLKSNTTHREQIHVQMLYLPGHLKAFLPPIYLAIVSFFL